MEEKLLVENFLSSIKIKCQFAEEINHIHIPADFIGYDRSYWYIVEVKTVPSDCERGIAQLLRYYDTLKWSKYNQNAPKGYTPEYKGNPGGKYKEIPQEDFAKFRHLKNEIPYGKRKIKLFLLYAKYTGIVEFEKFHTLFKTYLDNPNCPKIDFYYLGENKPIKL